MTFKGLNHLKHEFRNGDEKYWRSIDSIDIFDTNTLELSNVLKAGREVGGVKNAI